MTGGLETEQEYPYSARDGKCKFDRSDVKVTINGSVAISKNEDGKIIYKRIKHFNFKAAFHKLAGMVL